MPDLFVCITSVRDIFGKNTEKITCAGDIFGEILEKITCVSDIFGKILENTSFCCACIGISHSIQLPQEF